MEIMGLPISVIAMVAAQAILTGAWVFVLMRKLSKARRNCEWATGLISRLADEDNWGEITVMSSRNSEPQVYKTWTGEGDPQDLARRASK